MGSCKTRWTERKPSNDDLTEGRRISKMYAGTRRGRWSQIERELLQKELIERPQVTASELALVMGRNAKTVGREIKKIKVTQICLKTSWPTADPSTTQGHKTLKGTVNCILEGPMGSSMTQDWRCALQRKPVEVWTEETSSLISPPIERLLTASSPPSLADMETLNGKIRIEWVSMDGHSGRHNCRLGLATTCMLVQPLALVRVWLDESANMSEERTPPN